MARLVVLVLIVIGFFVGLSMRDHKKLEVSHKRFDYQNAKKNHEEHIALVETLTKPKVEETLDEEPDDSFLNAALSKARRLNRLRHSTSLFQLLLFSSSSCLF